MEDWLADGVPLAAPVAREALGGWYGANTPARGNWRVAGLAVDPAKLNVPAFCAIPGRDRLVPAASALPLAKALGKATIIEPTAGHIGMVAGTRAKPLYGSLSRIGCAAYDGDKSERLNVITS